VPPELKLQKFPHPDDLPEKSRSMIDVCNRNIEMVNNALFGAQDYAIIGKK